MPSFFDYRREIKSLVVKEKSFADEKDYNADSLNKILDSLNHGEMIISVVGEVNRGKSTFLNAMLGAKIFPTRASVCTAAVTVLDNAEEAFVEVTYKNSKCQKVELSIDDPAKTLIDIVSRKNENVMDISLVKIWYPNKFAGNGIVIVDTPGVNDPDTWREEITYSYLAQSDAVIMLLDPMQPISKSETEFLENKILGQSIANIIFVMTKIDDVSSSDRQDALKRINTMLSKYVPNPTVYPVSAKQAFNAKLNGDLESLGKSGFQELEKGLIEFLERGRGGLLLKTKLQKAGEFINEVQNILQKRKAALDSEREAVIENLKSSELQLNNIEKKHRELEKDVVSKKNEAKYQFEKYLRDKINYFEASLKQAIRHESDETSLKSTVFSFQRDVIDGMRREADEIFEKLVSSHYTATTALSTEVKGILQNLDIETENMVQALPVSFKKEVYRTRRKEGAAAAGAAVGGAVGAVAGISAAAGATATTVTAAGIVTTSAFGLAGVVGIGLLTGGLGLLAGGAIAAYMSSGDEQRRSQDSVYVEERQVVDNIEAVNAVKKFLKRLESAAGYLADSLIDSAKKIVFEPVKSEIASQRNLLEKVRGDLNRTEDSQAEIQKDLSSQFEIVKEMAIKYGDLKEKIEQI